jgi:hypothetical protein
MTPLLAAALLLAAGQQRAADPGTAPVQITVRVIGASPDPAPSDTRLAPIATNLADFGKDFRFKGYRLLAQRTFGLDWNQPGEMEIPGSRAITVFPRQMVADGRVQIHFELLGGHPTHKSNMLTDFTVPRGGTILVGGLQLDPSAVGGDVLLIAVTTDRVPEPGSKRVTPGEPNANVRPPADLQIPPDPARTPAPHPRP